MVTALGRQAARLRAREAAEAEDAAESLTSAPTTAKDVTRDGVILGTPSYMAPEQLEGKDADARSDIFAFGAVLYEMATGRKAFAGASQASLISAILSSEPPSISTLQPATPPALDRLVRTCLAKDPERALAERRGRRPGAEVDRGRVGGGCGRPRRRRRPQQTPRTARVGRRGGSNRPRGAFGVPFPAVRRHPQS